jgi:hypothetical protein
MKAIINSTLLLTIIALLTGCAGLVHHPDPLAGWKVDFDHQPDRAIVKDYQGFIQKLPPDQRGYNVGPIQFYEDGTGRHAIGFEVFVGTYTSWHYLLIYDTENKRAKVIKYGHTRYMS